MVVAAFGLLSHGKLRVPAELIPEEHAAGVAGEAPRVVLECAQV